MPRPKGIALNKGNRRAFTLIELLIVIAIIAILALIAIPNFLESQMRAKVSRAYADTRSLGAALAAYQVDYNCAPLGFWSMRSTMGWSTNDMTDNRPYDGLEVLTTPIAYSTSVPSDPFKDKGYINSKTPGVEMKERSLTYFYDSSRPMPNAAIITNGKDRDGLFWMHTNGHSWYLASPGPSRDSLSGLIQTISGQISGSTNTLYDPTNGTTSRGYIVRTSQGQVQSLVSHTVQTAPNSWY